MCNCRGIKTGTHHTRIFEERERFQNGQEAPERIGHYEKEAFERKTNYAEESLQRDREVNQGKRVSVLKFAILI